jgi:hypothetical protein
MPTDTAATASDVLSPVPDTAAQAADPLLVPGTASLATGTSAGTLLEQFPPQLQQSLYEVLSEMNGKTLASYRWRHRDDPTLGGESQVGLHLAPSSHQEPKKSKTNPWFQFRWTTGTQEVFSQPLQLQFSILKSESKVRVMLYLGLSEQHDEYTLIVFDLKFSPSFNPAAGQIALDPLKLPWPQNSPGLEELYLTWFAQSGLPREHSAIECLAASPEADLKTYWPFFNGDDCFLPAAPLSREAGADTIQLDRKEWGHLLMSYCLWASVTKTVGQGAKVSKYVKFCEPLLRPENRGLPRRELYTRTGPRRKALLLPHAVLEELSSSADPLHIPWHVIEAACAALNAGRHVIFTGPPGCGKSKLARRLAKMAAERLEANAEPLMATASEAWTSGDLIGRYLPRRDGKGLKFVPGFFLRAVREQRWLILDEFNRCNIDQCFGELFSVLAGDPVELPFEDGAVDAEPVPVRLLPGRHAQGSDGKGADYVIPPSFRLIGTMNDVDRGALHQLSFALLRRFGLIRIDPPSQVQMRELLKTEITRAESDAGLPASSYRFSKKGGKNSRNLALSTLREELETLFAGKPATKDSFADLIAERIVGVAAVADVLRFVAEGLQSPGGNEVVVEVEGDVNEVGHAVELSYLAMALVLCVFPQLDALGEDSLSRAVGHLLTPFYQGKKPIMLRRVIAERAADEQAELVFRVDTAKAESGSYDADGDGYLSIPEFLVGELLRQYRGSEHEGALRDALKAAGS